MKRSIFLALGLVPAAAWAQSNTFTLNAKIGHDMPPAKAYLIYRSGGIVLTDSAAVNQGTFKFTGTLTDPAKAQVILDHTGAGLAKLGRTADFDVIYLEKGDIVVTAKDSVKNAVIT